MGCYFNVIVGKQRKSRQEKSEIPKRKESMKCAIFNFLVMLSSSEATNMICF